LAKGGGDCRAIVQVRKNWRKLKKVNLGIKNHLMGELLVSIREGTGVRLRGFDKEVAKREGVCNIQPNRIENNTCDRFWRGGNRRNSYLKAKMLG